MVFGPIKFDYYSDVNIVLAVMMFVIISSFYIGSKVKNKFLINDYSNARSKILIFWFSKVSILVFISSIALLYLAIKNGYSVENLINEGSEVRDLKKDTSLFKKILSFIAYQGYGFIPILIVKKYRLMFSRNIQLIYVLSLIVLFSLVLLQAGRTIFLVLAISLFISHIVLGAKLNFKKITISIVLLIVAAVLLQILLELRVSENYLQSLINETQFRYNLIDSSTPSILQFLTFTNYFAGPLVGFSYLIEASNNVDLLFNDSLGVIAPFIYAAPTNDQVLLDNLEGLGHSSSAWLTGYGAIIAWHGFIPFVFFIIILYFNIAKMLKRWKSKPSLYNYLSLFWVLYLVLFINFYYPKDYIFTINIFVVYVLVNMLYLVIGNIKKF